MSAGCRHIPRERRLVGEADSIQNKVVSVVGWFHVLLAALDFERKLLCSVVSTPSESARFVSGVPNRLCGAEEACRHVRGEEAA
jgi:hypothetical protein